MLTCLRTDRNSGTRTLHLLPFLRNGSHVTRREFVASVLMLQHEQRFGPGTENRALIAAKRISIPALSEEFP
jgi:hypothetical protein